MPLIVFLHRSLNLALRWCKLHKFLFPEWPIVKISERLISKNSFLNWSKNSKKYQGTLIG